MALAVNLHGVHSSRPWPALVALALLACLAWRPALAVTDPLLAYCERSDAPSVASCLGYLGGFLDHHRAMADAGGPMLFCLPPAPMELGPLADYYVATIRLKPPPGDTSSMARLIYVLAELYPCGK